MKNNNSPFKLLDPYTLEDKDIFFGRDDEIQQLYEIVFQTSLMLVYGASGTGKTSLIKCGLAGRFKKTDWYDIYIRRQNNINDALRTSIQSNAKTPIPEQQDLAEMIDSLFLDYYKPIFLIFDQFEELFILGSKEEQDQFINDIARLLRREDMPCKIIIVMREEYIAQLYDFEKVIPELFDKRVRIEPMSQTNTRKVITKTCAQFNIHIKDKVADDIVDVITEERGRVQLPYLQVYLDKLYKKAYDKNAPTIEFNHELLAKAGRMDDVLVDFLEEQLDAFEKTFKDKNTALSFLKIFVSNKGTKVPIKHYQISVLLPRYSIDQTHDYLNFFVSRRIIRPLENEQYELTHDSLAARIHASEVLLFKMPDSDQLFQYPIPPNPYPGYRHYTQQMSTIFFGRDREIQTLFDKIVNESGSKITLVYGRLGVGKTSLVLAGLVPRVEHFFKVNYLKLGKAIIEDRQLQQLLNTPNKKGNFYELLIPKEQQVAGPEVIILDQFEEIFIWLNEFRQIKNFYERVANLLKSRPLTKMIFVVREEFFSRLSDFETILPDVLDSRIRIDNIDYNQAFEIIQSSTQTANIGISNESVIDRIIQNVSGVDGSVNPTYLQIYMDRIYHEVATSEENI